MGQSRQLHIHLAVKKEGAKTTRKQDRAAARGWSEEFRKALSEDRYLRKTMVEEMLQQVLEGEMEEALQAGKSEPTEIRPSYRAGYYNRALVTRVHKVELRVRKDRQGRLRTEVFERYQRSEKALVAAMLEMYVQGVSTRRVKPSRNSSAGHEFSSLMISGIVGPLDAETGEVREAAPGRTYPSLVFRRSLRKGAGRRSRAKPSRADSDRHQTGKTSAAYSRWS